MCVLVIIGILIMFCKDSKKSPKKLSKAFVDILILNAIIPFQFAYHRRFVTDDSSINDYLLMLVTRLNSEKNSIVALFSSLGVQCEHAMDSQALLQLKKEYCDQQRCLSCTIGKRLMK